MKHEEIEKLIGISEEIAQKIFEPYHFRVERQLEGIDSARGIQLLQALMEEESAKRRSAKIPAYAEDKTDLAQGLLVNPSPQNVDIVFRPWYESFCQVENDSEYMNDIIRFEPQLIEDGVFLHERNLYKLSKNPDYSGTHLEDTSFFWNVHIMVMAYQCLTQKRITYLEGRVQTFTNIGNGLNCNLGPEQKQEMFSKLVAEKYIHESTNERNFTAAMTPQVLPRNFEKIKWTLLGKGVNPHKTALSEFLDIYCEPTQGRSTNLPHQEDINRIFCDASGNAIILLNPTRAKPSNHYSYLENLISG